MDNSPAGLTNLPEVTVGEISRSIKRSLEDSFGRVRVRGEFTQVRRNASGHWYGGLKDSDAKLDIVCFRREAARLERFL